MKIVLDTMPKNLEEFKNMKEMDLSKAKNICVMFLCDLDLFLKDRNQGIDAINILKRPIHLNPHEISFLADRFRDKDYLGRIYFECARAENNYKPDEPFTLTFYPDGRPQDCEYGYIRSYLQTSGEDAKRAIKLMQKDNNWYIWEYPALVMDVRKPSAEDPWV